MHFDPRKILAENLYRVIFVRDQSNPHAWTGGNAAFKQAVQRALAGENTTVQALAEIARRAAGLFLLQQSTHQPRPAVNCQSYNNGITVQITCR